MTIPHDELVAAANKDPTIFPWWVSVLYGDYGNSKTITACSLVKEKGLMLSTDDSWKVLLSPKHSALKEKITVKPLEGLSQLKYIDFNGYDTIIWDTVSQSVDNYLDLLSDEVTWPGNLREKVLFKRNSSKPEDLKDLESLGFVDYRVTRDAFRPVLNRLFRETEAHIVFTSQMREPIPGMGKNQQRRPAIPDATFKIIGTRADLIANVRINGTKFVVDTTQSLTQLGKSRIEGIQGSMDQDTFIKKYKEIVFK